MVGKLKNVDISALKKLPGNVATSATDIVAHVTDYLKVSQVEQTKRAEITARRDCALATIQARREIIMQAVDRTFQERAAVLQAQLNALEHAIKNGDPAIVAKSLDCMVQVIQTSPFKNIAEVHQMLSDKNSVLLLD